MCGIAVIYRKRGSTVDLGAPVFHEAGQRMLGTLAHRGPDERSLVAFGEALLGHTRLSIIDIAGGSQPMYNEDRSVGVVFNGEIYDYREHRARLLARGHRLATSSDTEVIAHLYEEHGERVFEQLNGMFATVIHDRRDGSLVAARDRLGEKPLLYWESDDLLVIASELKAILELPIVAREIDTDALRLYLSALYVPAPYTIFKGIRKLPPGHLLRAGEHGVEIRPYWQLEVSETEPRLDEPTFVRRFTELFDDAVRRRLVADVPVGVLLSGGIDSSAVTAFAATSSTEPIRTFAVGFAGARVDERPFARQVSERYGTAHTELLVEYDLQTAFETVQSYFDEPFADSSAIPVYLIARVAREHVKVMLTGDGGDELFAGYPFYVRQKYQTSSRVATKLLRTLADPERPAALRQLAGAFVPRVMSDRARRHWVETRSFWFDAELDVALGRNGFRADTFFDSQRIWLGRGRDPLSFAFSWDMSFYLPDDLLKKVDMASMLVSLECRAPFLDHRLVELCFSVSPRLKLAGDQPKHLLKRALAARLPEAVVERRKQGFGAPVGAWLRGPLRAFSRDLLAPGCRTEAHVSRAAIDRALSRLDGGDEARDYRIPHRLWQLLVLEHWLRRYARA